MAPLFFIAPAVVRFSTRFHQGIFDRQGRALEEKEARAEAKEQEHGERRRSRTTGVREATGRSAWKGGAPHDPARMHSPLQATVLLDFGFEVYLVQYDRQSAETCSCLHRKVTECVLQQQGCAHETIRHAKGDAIGVHTFHAHSLQSAPESANVFGFDNNKNPGLKLFWYLGVQQRQKRVGLRLFWWLGLWHKRLHLSPDSPLSPRQPTPILSPQGSPSDH